MRLGKGSEPGDPYTYIDELIAAIFGVQAERLHKVDRNRKRELDASEETLCAYCTKPSTYRTVDGVLLCGDVRCGNAYREQ